MQWGTVQRILSGLVHFHVVQTLPGKAVGSIRYSIGYNRIRYKRPQQATEVVLKGLHTSARQCRRSTRYNGIRYNRWQATAAVLSRFAHLHVVQTLQGKTRFNTTQWDTVQQVTGYCSCPVKVCTSPCSSNTARQDTIQYDTMGYNTPQQVTAAAFSELAYFHACPQHWTGEQHSSTQTEKWFSFLSNL